MGAQTSIEWAANADGTPGATWNPVRARDKETGKVGTFCVHASAGCINCYAETFQQRSLPGNGIGLAYTAQNLKRVEIYLDWKMLGAPLRRRKPTTWFLSSMTDVFGEFVPDDMIDKLFATMGLCPQHTFIVLTKRAERMRQYFAETWQLPARPAEQIAGVEIPAQAAGTEDRWDHINLAVDHVSLHPTLEKLFNDDRFWSPEGSLIGRPAWPHAPYPNVVLGVSVEDQANADERIPHLLATPAACRAISAEPLLGPVDLGWALSRNRLDIAAGIQMRGRFAPGLETLRSLDWVIAGGESGHNARPMHPDWARALRDQCAAAGAEFFCKQWGEWKEWRHDEDGPQVVTIETDEQVEAAVQALVHIRHPVGGLTRSGTFYPTLDAWTASDEEEPVRVMERLGKRRAGRLLDGVEHNGRPALLTGGRA